jgi:putative ABC transport system ATP-binding protein
VRRHTVSFIFQSFNLFPALTAAENVQFGADVAGVPDAAGVAADMLERVGLGDRGRHFAHQLSGGEQQRVAIARALATGNPVLLADEPTGELDFRTGVRILELLQAQAAAGKTVLVVTHNREISRVADRVIELSSGRIVADGPPAGGRADVADLRW